MKTAVLLAWVFAGMSFAQSVEFGIKGGWPLAAAFPAQSSYAGTGSSNSTGFVIGPTVELRLPFFGLGVEGDALYRQVDFPVQAGNGIVSASAGTWEFPILAKYRFGPPLVKPYVEAGPVFRATGSSVSSLSKAGFALGGGIEIGFHRLHVSPELRYEHWDAGNEASAPLGYVKSNQNQAELLIGLSF